MKAAKTQAEMQTLMQQYQQESKELQMKMRKLIQQARERHK